MDPTMRINTVDPHDDEQVAAWHAAFVAGDSHERVHVTTWVLPEVLAAVRRPARSAQRHMLAAVEGDQIVGAGMITMPQLENTHLAVLGLAVPPQHRRRGIGSALLTDLLERARARGRSTAVVEVNYPCSGYDEHPGRRLATRHGFTEASSEVHRVLDLPVDPGVLERRAQEVEQHHGSYRLVHWVDRCPQEWVAAYADLTGGFLSEVPLGDLELENEKYDVQRIREDEEMRLAQGRTTYVTLAVAADGALAGNTVLVVPGHDPGVAYQWGTLVLPAHRGHRLGLAMKLANVRAMQDAHPEIEIVHTWNAGTNAPMTAVNDALGFRDVECFGEFQRSSG